MKSSIERVEWPRVQMVCGWAMSLDPGQGVFPVHGDVVGPVAADLVLRRVFAGPAGVALVAGIGGMHLDDGAADPAGLGVPADVIIDLESGCHGRLLRTGVPVFCDRQRRGRLCRQSAGRPPVPGLGWRDRQPRTGGELWKPWNCIAADCWIPTVTISRWSIMVPPGAVRLRYRSPSTFSREPEPGGKESTAAVN